ncbi:MAG TPA: matrixin family metalloprotease [Lacipirellulaceae bacterium]|nr:matrixin family metalloprotease [Lacipirellulaceae bacterium]
MSRVLKLSLLLSVIAVVESSPPNTALAYVIGGSPWTGSPITLTYSYVNVFDGGIKMPDGNPLPNSLIKGSIEEALGLWSSVVPVNWVEVPDSSASTLRFRHIFINGPDPPPPADPIAKAQATCIGRGFGCEVQYDDSDRWQEVGTQPNPDVLGATIHEVGHILGLQHSLDPTANMYWIFTRFDGLGTGQLFADDIAGIRALYGPGVGSVTPLALPEPNGWLLLAAVLCALPFAGRRRRYAFGYSRR